MAVMSSMPWAGSDSCSTSPKAFTLSSPTVHPAPKIGQILEFANVFRGRELTRKHDRIPCDLPQLDSLIQGGIVRGRISEIVAEPGAGKTSLAAAFAANVTRGESVAWIATSDDFDPVSIAEAGVDLMRLLWVSSKGAKASKAGVPASLARKPELRASRFPAIAASLKAAEWILAAGGFGLAILDFGDIAFPLSQSAVLRLARAAERSGAGILVVAPRRICGTFAVLSLTLHRERACFSHLWQHAPALFDGLRLEACVTRNKLGRSGQTAKWATACESSEGAQRSRAYTRNEVEPASLSPRSSKGNESSRRACQNNSATRVYNRNSFTNGSSASQAETLFMGRAHAAAGQP